MTTHAADRAIDWEIEGDRCVLLLQDLIRVPTVNRGTGEEGDGNERPAAERIAEFLREAGVEPTLLERSKGRSNVVARVKGTGDGAPLLLNAHLDVVDADETKWKKKPFGGEIDGGYLWGRGAIDMKHMAAMSACVLALVARRAKEGAPLARDLVFTGVADEEAGCDEGARFLVDEYADLVRAEYMLGEVGGFSVHLFGKTFFPVQVAEKGAVWLRARVEGEPGHGSMPRPDSAVVRLAAAVAKLGRTRLPMHPTAVVKGFLEGIARELPAPQRQVFRGLEVPRLAALILEYLVRDDSQRRSFGAMLSNTASPTVLRAGGKVNVIPGVAEAQIDGRTLPGQTESDLLRELRDVMGSDVDFEVLRSMPPVESPVTSPLYVHLARTIERHHPGGIAVPNLTPGFTDAKAFSRLGTKCYGFAPVRFDPTHDVSFPRMYHGHDERVPVDGLVWGLETLYDAVVGFEPSR